jgi:hypothetical protein
MKKLLFAVPYVIFLTLVYFCFVATQDDPFITFRYSANLLAGHGPVYNIGERVEGYTSPLHMLISALLLLIFPGIGILFKAKIFGILMGLTALGLVKPLSLECGLNEKQSLLAQILLALSINFALAATNGLETTFYCAAVTLLAFVYCKERRKKQFVYSGFLTFIAMLIRPEAAALFGLLLIDQIILCRKKEIRAKSVLIWGVLFAVPALLFEIWRVSYYGEMLPNTFYAKNIPFQKSAIMGISYLRICLDFSSPSFGEIIHQHKPSQLFDIFSEIVFWGLAGFGIYASRGKSYFSTIAAFITALIVFSLKSGGDWMMGWRFAAGYLAIITVAQCIGIQYITKKRNSRSKIEVLSVIAIWCLAALITTSQIYKNSEPLSVAGISDKGLLEGLNWSGLNKTWVITSDMIGRIVPKGSTIAYSEMGIAGYENMHINIIDFCGLTDKKISHFNAFPRGRVGIDWRNWTEAGSPYWDILNDRKPSYLFFLNSIPPDGMNRLNKTYRQLTPLSMRILPGQYMDVFKRRDI